MANYTISLRNKQSDSITVNHDHGVYKFYELRIQKPPHTFMIFKICDEDNKQEIIAEYLSESTDYDDFLIKLPQNEPRYAVYYFKKESFGNIVFYNWLPEGATVDQKSVYERHKYTLLETMCAISFEVTGYTVYDDEISYEKIVHKILENNLPKNHPSLRKFNPYK